MGNQKIVVLTEKENSQNKILSPMVAQASIFVSNNQIIDSNFVLGQLICLNKKYDLVLPKNLAGKVQNLAKSQIKINLEYKQEIFELISVSKLNLKNNTHTKFSTDKNSQEGIFSPMDGMLYLSPSPKETPFVRIGQHINPGETVGLIEVMKCFYPITYTGKKARIITKIVLKTGSPIRSGERILTLG